MKLLFISNFYPPLELGGWEQLTQEIVVRLRARGHEAAVLTSRYGADEVAGSESGVYRLLRLESEDILHYHPWTIVTRGRHERENFCHLEGVIADFSPDIIFFHSMWNLPRSLAWRAERLMPNRVVYYAAGDWPYAPNAHEAYWSAPTRRRLLRWPKQVVASFTLALLRRERRARAPQFQHILCVSQAIREDLAQFAGIPLERSCVVYNGIDADQFAPPADWNPAVWRNGFPALLYAGSLGRHKGVHTAIQGFAAVVRQAGIRDVNLTIAGGGHPTYENHLRQMARDLGIADRVRFLGRVDRSQMPELLRDHDIFIFPSSWAEPLARMMQEAMACGLMVVGTTTGGSKELLVENVTGLTFEAEDAEGLARQIERVVADPNLRYRLARAGREAVLERFTLERMIDETECYLEEVVAGSTSPSGRSCPFESPARQ